MPSKASSTAHRRSNNAAQPDSVLHVEVPSSFDLGLAVSSYGFFMLPPNQWVKVRAIEPRSPDCSVWACTFMRYTRTWHLQAEASAKAGFKRPLRLPSEESVVVMVTQGERELSAGLDVAIETPSKLSDTDEDFLREQANSLF